MVVIDDHAHVRMLHRVNHLQSLCSGVQNIAFLMTEWLDGNRQVVMTRDVPSDAKECGDLFRGALPGKAVRNVARPRAAPHDNRSTEATTASKTRLEIILERRQRSFVANDLQICATDKAVERLAANR